MSWITTIIGDLTGSTELTDAEKGVDVAVRFFQVLTDGAMWRSLGWLLLGLVLFGLGLTLLLREPIERAAGTVAKAVAL
jgi:hypothetical protein